MKNIFLLCMLLSWSCSRVFDAPEPFPDADIKPTMTIQQLKALHTTKGRFDRITADAVIAGVVTADDRSGNFYRNIVLQDTTGGIAVLLERTGLYNDYPTGRKVFIKVKGLMLGDYRGLIQLGADVDISDPSDFTLAGISASLFSRYLIKGSLNNVVQPVTVTKTQLTTALQDPWQNMLIQLQNVEFEADSSATYANAKSRITGSYRLVTCTDTVLAVRTSAYATFASVKLPLGKGTVTGIYTVFNNDKQLMIRDTTDVRLRGIRCVRNSTPETETPYTAGMELTGPSPLLLHFNTLDSLLPQGMHVYTEATAGSMGTIADFVHTRASWAVSSGGFKNYASATGLQVQSTQAQQQASANRAPGVRQVTATDKGVAFVFEINNTTGKKGLELQFDLQSLDAAAERTTQWTVDYALGTRPAAFSPLPTVPALLTTGGGRFGNTAVTVALPEALENSSRKLTLRMVVLTPTTGGGSRASAAIDDVRISWR